MDSTLTTLRTRLAAFKGRWPLVADSANVPASTLRKIAQGHVKDPRIETVDRLMRALDKLERQ